MSTAQLIAFADREGVELPTTDPALLFDFADLADFLEAFRAAHQVITTADDFTRVTYDGVRAAVSSGAVHYREYAINRHDCASDSSAWALWGAGALGALGALGAAAIIALVPRLSAGCAKFPTVTI